MIADSSVLSDRLCIDVDNLPMQKLAFPEFKALIFDADGTLVDTEFTTIDVLYELAVLHGLSLSRDEAYRVFRGRRMASCIEHIQVNLNITLPPDFIDEVRRVMAKRFESGVQTMPGATSLVQFLHSHKKIPFCVATNGPRMKVSQTLELSQLIGYFGDRIYSAYEVGSFKPDPGLFLHAAKSLQIAPEHCAVVEDSLPGVEAGLAARMQVFYVGPPELLDIQNERVHSIQHLDILKQYLMQKQQIC